MIPTEERIVRALEKMADSWEKIAEIYVARYEGDGERRE